MSTTTDIRSVLVLDNGPVSDALCILGWRSTLSEHVTVTVGEHITEVEITDDIPFAYWGSGTQALWRLASAMAYSAAEVSLYEVVSRLDTRNRAAVAQAVAAFCGVTA